MLEKIVPLIITYNEAPNICRTLDKLSWAKKIVVIDSYSTDSTLEILNSYSQVQIFQRKFDSFASQCNYGLEKINSEWVLSLDADYILTDELIAEMAALTEDNPVDGYFVKFKYCIYGKPLRATLLPPRQVLYRREKAKYVDDGHAHRVLVNGQSAMLSSYICHDDRKPLNRWLSAQNRYMIIESKKLLETPGNQLSLPDRLRKQKFIAPFLILVYCLIVNRAILDGWQGFYYTLQRTLAEIMLSLYLLENENSSTYQNQSSSENPDKLPLRNAQLQN